MKMKMKTKTRRTQILSPSSSTNSAKVPMITKTTNVNNAEDVVIDKFHGNFDFYSNVHRRFSTPSYSKVGHFGSSKYHEMASNGEAWNKGSFSVSSSGVHGDFDVVLDGFRASAYRDKKISAKKKHQKLPKSLHNSRASSEYERSSIGIDGSEVQYHVLPPVPEEMSFLQRKGISTTQVSALSEGFEKATPVTDEYEEEEYRIKHRPKPFKEFLDEIQSIKQKAEVDTVRKQLLRKFREKEAAIDEWASTERSIAENQLDKFERKLERKLAKAVQRTHKKLAKTSMEAENRKAKARRSVLKQMTKLPLNSR